VLAVLEEIESWACLPVGTPIFFEIFELLERVNK
jgi:hypothetical protein